MQRPSPHLPHAHDSDVKETSQGWGWGETMALHFPGKESNFGTNIWTICTDTIAQFSQDF